MTRLVVRNAWSAFMIGVAALSAGVAAALLAVIVTYVVRNGAGAINFAFFTQVPRPVGLPGGCVANAIFGSAVVIVLASLAAVPLGTAAGVYLALFGRGKLAASVRFLSDVLTGVPSIAIGVFAYALVVLPTRQFSALSASLMSTTLRANSMKAYWNPPQVPRNGQSRRRANSIPLSMPSKLL